MDAQIAELVNATKKQTIAENERINLERGRIELEETRYKAEKEKLAKLDLIITIVNEIKALLELQISPGVQRTTYWTSLLLEMQRLIALKYYAKDPDVENKVLQEIIAALSAQDINLNFTSPVETVIGQKK